MRTLIHYAENMDGFHPICGKNKKTILKGWETTIWKNWDMVNCKECLKTK